MTPKVRAVIREVAGEEGIELKELLEGKEKKKGGERPRGFSRCL